MEMLRWTLLTLLIVIPFAGVLIYLVLLALERYWWEFNEQSMRVFNEIQAQTEKARAERAAGKESEAAPAKGPRGIAPEVPEEVKRKARIIKGTEQRKQALETMDPRRLSQLLSTVMAGQEKK